MRFNSIRFLGLSILAVCIVGNSPRGWAQDKDNAEVTVSATATKIDAAGKQKVTVTFDMQKDWHIYANPVKNKSFASSQTRVAVKAMVKLADVKITYPKGKLHEDKDEGSSMIYEDRAVVEIAVQEGAGRHQSAGDRVRLQRLQRRHRNVPAAKESQNNPSLKWSLSCIILDSARTRFWPPDCVCSPWL